ncbi:hypothetical protein KSP40_PGU016782 [Platanthera guangdongensis]|uniref:Sec-independent protein translocase protein TatB n=1 Tax=Platanthera guangdongensis TaxID=2320717 RepID=A0ABR2MXR0_9ASPA
MFGISYGELLLIIGATAALLGPKDLPIISRAAGRLTGRAIGYVQVARGQFGSVMQQSQVNQLHKELQDALTALETIRYQIRGISIMNPVPPTRILEGMEPPAKIDAVLDEKSATDLPSVVNTAENFRRCQDLGSANTNPSRLYNEALTYGRQDLSSANTNPSRLYNEALTYGRLAEAPGMKEILNGGDVLPSVLPVSAESAQLLPKLDGDVTGSDIVLEAILEAEVARNAKQFFSLPENQVPKE